MNIYEKIRKIKLSGSEKDIVALIEKDPFAFSEMTLSEICRKSFVSKATLYRLCDKLELNGLSDLKLALKRDESDFRKDKEYFDFDYPIKIGDSNRKIANVLKEDYEKTVGSTLNLMLFDQLNYVAREIDRAECVDIYTSAGNIFFAHNFQFQMQEINKKVYVPEESYVMGLTAASSSSTHFSIMISFGGRGKQLESIAQILKDKGSRILLICSEEAQTLMKFADYKLYMCPNEDHYKKISSFSTRLSLLYILDVIYTVVFKEHYEQNKEYKTKTYQQMVKHN